MPTTDLPPGWSPPEAAPLDRTVAVLAGGMIFRATLVIDPHLTGAPGWSAEPGERHPPCWSEGYCWAVNEDGQPSAPVTGWRESDD